jgi:rhamnosyltransferase
MGELKPYVKHSITSMSRLCTDIIFVSNSPLDETDLAYLQTGCKHILINKNNGFDFTMWKTALQLVNYSGYDEIVLMNSSIYGPITPIEAVFDEMDSSNSDFWGITECFQRQPHLQSYFLVFRKSLIMSHAFRAFWDGVLPYRDKLQVIMSYETGLTLWLRESGFRMDVFRSFEALAPFFATQGRRIRKNDNVTLRHPVELMLCGSPFLKKELIRKRSIDLTAIEGLLAANNYPFLLNDSAHSANRQLCPLCGTSGRLRRKGVRDYQNLYNTGRYDFCRCTSLTCSVIWRINAEADDLLPRPGLRCRTPDGAVRVFGEHELTDMAGGIFSSIELEDEPSRSHDPGGLLFECRRLLNPGGTLMLRVPNADALTLTIFGSYWHGLNAPRYRIIFTRKSLRTLLEQAGFRDFCITASNEDSGGYVLKSLHIALNRWTYPGLSTFSRMKLTQKLLCMAFSLVVMIAGKLGDEYRVKAYKPS